MKINREAGIYLIRNRTNGKLYIGSATDLLNRWSRHKSDLKKNKHPNKHLQAAWNKYGEETFVFEVIEYTPKLTEREQYWLDKYEAVTYGYNICSVARSSRGRPGTPLTEKHKQKLRELRKGVPVFPAGDEHPNRKITLKQEKEIYSRFKNRAFKGSRWGASPDSGPSLAKEFNVHIETIYRIIHKHDELSRQNKSQ